MNEDKYVIKYYYDNKFIGYHNSYGESRGMVWTRLYAGSEEQYIKKYDSERGAKIGSNSAYWEYSHDLIINTDSDHVTVHFDNCFIKEIRNQGFGISEDKIRKEICKLAEIGNDTVDLSELKEIEARYNKHLDDMNKKDEAIQFHPTQDKDEVDPNLQEQWDTALNILGLEDDDIVGDYIYFDHATIEQLHALITVMKDFWDPEMMHNDCPGNGVLLKFIEENPQFIAEIGIAGSDRDDYRLEIVGVKAESNKENKVILYDFINSLGIDNQPDEYGEYQGYTRAWWD